MSDTVQRKAHARRRSLYAAIVLLVGGMAVLLLAWMPQIFTSPLGSARRGADVWTALFQIHRDPTGTVIAAEALEAVGYVWAIEADPRFSIMLAIRSPRAETKKGIVFPEAQLQLVATSERRWGPGIDALSDLFVVNLSYEEAQWVLEHGVAEAVSNDLLHQAYAAGSFALSGGGAWNAGSEKTSEDFPLGTFSDPVAGDEP